MHARYPALPYTLLILGINMMITVIVVARTHLNILFGRLSLVISFHTSSSTLASLGLEIDNFLSVISSSSHEVVAKN
ncbi:hypothetical protein BDD12DRAFT_846195 [Trichophaea hybrida]|nr:hypothetical protein BDD12DRAFT_846195 [Trichophaea hybrida]